MYPSRSLIKTLEKSSRNVAVLNQMIANLPEFVNSNELKNAISILGCFPWKDESLVVSPDIRMTTWRLVDSKNTNRYYFGEILKSSKRPEGRGILLDITKEIIMISTFYNGRAEGFGWFIDG